MTDDTHPIQQISTKLAWQSQWYQVREDAVRLPDGSEGVYNVLEMRDSVFVVPVLDDGRIVLIRNYRYPLQEWVWEIPAGGIKAGQSPDEAARDELLEEAGGVAQKLQFLLKANTINGIGNHHAYFYLATGVTLQAPEQEAMEFISVHPLSIDEVYKLATNGSMNDAVSITALLLAHPHIVSVSGQAAHE